MAAMGMIVAAIIVGSAVDLSRAYRAKSRLQAACDAAVLAGRRTVTTKGFDAAAEDAADDYFATNFDDDRLQTRSTSFVATADDKGNTVAGKASTVLDTVLMRLFGFDNFSLSADCSASMGVGNADVMMVLDTTGSMSTKLSGSQTRIDALQEAMKNFYETLADATSGTNARIRYGFVPYSSSVNVGRLIHDLDPDYLVDKRKYQSREYVDGAWNYRQIEYDVSDYKAFESVDTETGSKASGQPKTVTSTWAGCIEERATTPAVEFNYNSSVDKITPVSARDVDLDDAPESDDDDSKWAPMWPEVAFERLDKHDDPTTHDSAYGQQAKSYCPYKSQLLTEMDKDSFDEYANALKADGSTYLDIGMIWGGRLLSPDGIFQKNVNDPPSNGGEVSRHIVFMTDGFMQPDNEIQQAWGMEYWDRRVTANGINHDDRRHSSRFLAVCEAIKAKGIRVWVIAFTSDLSDDLNSCASDNSSFTASDGDELNSAFQEIAKQVGELRIVQ